MKSRRYPALDFESRAQEEEYASSGPPRWPNSYPEVYEEFRSLVDGRASEATIHEYLERHPILLPLIDACHHGPYDGVIATKLPLANDFVTDFAFVTSNSQTLRFVGIEIESPRKCLFRKDGSFHRDYLDARQQLADWVLWARHNVRDALDSWGRLFQYHRMRDWNIEFQGILVFGRRADIGDDPKRQQRWSGEGASLHAAVATMTYDRLLDRKYLIPDMDNDRLVVCSYRDRRFQVKHLCA
jgi:hypothetical protein